MRKRFPRTLREAVTCFASADECRDLVARLRWPDGILCPSCGSSDIRAMQMRAAWRCGLCRRQFSAKVGTIFQDSSIGLHKWLAAVWVCAIANDDVSSHELARSLRVTQKSAWFMLERIGLARHTKGFRAPVYGSVDIEGAFSMRARAGSGKRQTRRKASGALTADRLASQRLVEFTRRLLNVSKAELEGFRARRASE